MALRSGKIAGIAETQWCVVRHEVGIPGRRERSEVVNMADSPERRSESDPIFGLVRPVNGISRTYPDVALSGHGPRRTLSEIWRDDAARSGAVIFRRVFIWMSVARPVSEAGNPLVQIAAARKSGDVPARSWRNSVLLAANNVARRGDHRRRVALPPSICHQNMRIRFRSCGPTGRLPKGQKSSGCGIAMTI